MGLTFSPNTYAGEVAAGYIFESLLNATPIQDYLTVFPNIKKRTVIRTVAKTTFLQAEVCNFVTSGDTAFGEKYLDPVTMSVMDEVCFKDLRTSWEAAKLKAGRQNETVPSDLAQFWVELQREQIAIAIEKLIFNGDTTLGANSQLGFNDGLIKLWLADATVIDVDITGTPASPGITAANVIANLSLVYSAIPETIRDAPDLVWVTTPAIAAFYKLSIAAGTGNGGAYYLGDKPLNFLGNDMFVIKNLPANTIAVFRRSNVWFGTDLLSDLNQVRTVDMRDTTNDNKVRYRADFAMDVNYGYGSEIVLAQ